MVSSEGAIWPSVSVLAAAGLSLRLGRIRAGLTPAGESGRVPFRVAWSMQMLPPTQKRLGRHGEQKYFARDDLQPSSRSLALPGARAGSVMVSLNLDSRVLAKHKMGPAFSHFGRLRRGLSFCFCRVPPCIFVPCTWRFSDPPDPGMSFAPGTYPRALAFMRRRQTTWVQMGLSAGVPKPREISRIL